MLKLQKYFRDTSNTLFLEYKKSNNLEHKTLKGNCRELFINDFLTNFFPNKFVVDTGEIIDSSGQCSKQCDVVVYDEYLPVFEYGKAKQFLSGGVLAHIEVKSKLGKKELDKSLEITKSIKGINRDIDSVMSVGDVPKRIFSSVFAYEGIKKENFKKYIQDFYTEESESIDNIVDCVCVLNKYVLLKYKKNGQIKMAFLETKEDSLLAFFTQLFGAMQKNWMGIADIYKYLGVMNYTNF